LAIGGNSLRPLKDILFEEYWEIAFRKIENNETLLDNGGLCFELLKSDKSCWYADPFLFERGGRLYLFMEVFDSKTELGYIGCSEYDGCSFSKPIKVLQEDFHLSYPHVFERDGHFFMMPETHQANCIELYRAVEFPYRWEKHGILVNNINAVDTDLLGNHLITCRVCESNDMSVDLCVINFENGRPCEYSPVASNSFDKRCAGAVFKYDGKSIRPSQDCSGKSYGNRIHFWHITECSDEKYDETLIKTIRPDDICLKNGQKPLCIHTYAKSGKIEIVDVKFRRLNFKRILWIIKNRI
jgi:hypothetical protein